MFLLVIYPKNKGAKEKTSDLFKSLVTDFASFISFLLIPIDFVIYFSDSGELYGRVKVLSNSESFDFSQIDSEKSQTFIQKVLEISKLSGVKSK